MGDSRHDRIVAHHQDIHSSGGEQEQVTVEEQVVQIIIDDRESRSGLIEELIAYNYKTTSLHVSTHVEVARLEVGDIICSDRTGVERKSCADFVDSFINRDLYGQVADLARTFMRPLVILEGRSVYGIRQVSPEALRGALSAIVTGWGVPIVPTANVAETAAFVVTTARREQYPMQRGISIPHTKRSTMSLPQRQRYTISAIGSGVGDKVAADLLHHFGSVKAVIDADIEALTEVDGIGVKTAEGIHTITRSNYPHDSKT